MKPTLPLLILAAAAAAATIRAEVAQPKAELGKPAPDFTLPDPSGTNWTLSAQKGRYVVLEWINVDCPFVKKHYGSGNMQTLQKAYTEKGVVWFAICSSAPGKQGHYAPAQWPALLEERKAKPSAVLLDPEGKVGRLYGARTTPHMYIIDPEGLLIYAGAIDNQPSPDPKTLAEARNYIREVLDAALEGKPVSPTSTQPYGCSVKY